MKRHFLKIIPHHLFLTLTLVAILTLTASAFLEQDNSEQVTLNSLFKSNSYVLEVENGSLAGEGYEFLLEATANAQFVAIAEEHNRLQIPEITTMLFSALHNKYGFNYLALEQGTVVTKMFNAESLAGNFEAIGKFALKYTNAPTFITDQELKMISDAFHISDAPHDRVWGLDQEFGALHILDRLKEQAPSEEAGQYVQKLIEKALPYESDRFAAEKLFIADIAEPKDFTPLPALFHAKKGSDLDFLIENLIFSNSTYDKNIRGRQGELTAYEGNFDRESFMKSRFMTEYRQAQKKEDPLPKVLLKLGHWHVYRGIYRGNVHTLGNFLSEFAISNEMESFFLSTALLGDPDNWRNTSGPIAESVDPEKWTIIDFRPLRKYAHANRISDLDDGMKSLLFRVDAILVIGGAGPGTYKLTKDKLR